MFIWSTHCGFCDCFLGHGQGKPILLLYACKVKDNPKVYFNFVIIEAYNKTVVVLVTKQCSGFTPDSTLRALS